MKKKCCPNPEFEILLKRIISLTTENTIKHILSDKHNQYEGSALISWHGCILSQTEMRILDTKSFSDRRSSQNGFLRLPYVLCSSTIQQYT
jgi:hypothetical protein